MDHTETESITEMTKSGKLKKIDVARLLIYNFVTSMKLTTLQKQYSEVSTTNIIAVSTKF